MFKAYHHQHKQCMDLAQHTHLMAGFAQANQGLEYLVVVTILHYSSSIWDLNDIIQQQKSPRALP